MRVRMDVDDFRSLLSPVKAAHHEGLLSFYEEEMVVSTADPANVAFVEVSVPAESFEKYDVDHTEKMGVSVETIDDRLKNGDGVLDLSLDTETAELKFVMPEANLAYRYRFMDKDNVPSTDFAADEIAEKMPNSVVSHGSSLHNVGSTAADMESHMRFEATAGESPSLVATVDSDMENFRMRLSEDDVEEMDINEKTSSIFPTEYISDALKEAKGVESVEVVMGQDHPVLFEYDVLGEDSESQVRSFIAPRIETDAAK